MSTLPLIFYKLLSCDYFILSLPTVDFCVLHSTRGFYMPSLSDDDFCMLSLSTDDFVHIIFYCIKYMF